MPEQQSVLEFNSSRDVVHPGTKTAQSQRDNQLQEDTLLAKSITKRDDSFNSYSDLSIVFDNIDGM